MTYKGYYIIHNGVNIPLCIGKKKEVKSFFEDTHKLKKGEYKVEEVDEIYSVDGDLALVPFGKYYITVNDYSLLYHMGEEMSNKISTMYEYAIELFQEIEYSKKHQDLRSMLKKFINEIKILENSPKKKWKLLASQAYQSVIFSHDMRKYIDLLDREEELKSSKMRWEKY